MLKKQTVSWPELQSLISKICRDITISGWMPDYVVGITRGGLIPAVMISHWFDVPLETLKVSLRDCTDYGLESNLWMAEDAFGYKDGGSDPALRKNILIVDDINDTGATLNWIKEDWPEGCMPNDTAWNDVWGNNVRVATLFENLASESTLEVHYSGVEINKAENNVWIDFPFEEWWTK